MFSVLHIDPYKLLQCTITISLVQIWRLAILEPVAVQRHNVPHCKGLIVLYFDSRSSRAWQHFYLPPRSFEKGHFREKKGARGWHSFSLTVHICFLICQLRKSRCEEMNRLSWATFTEKRDNSPQIRICIFTWIRTKIVLQSFPNFMVPRFH